MVSGPMDFDEEPPPPPPERGLVKRQETPPPAKVVETSGQAAAAQGKAAVEARYLMALRQPRNMLDVQNKLIDACKRPGFAEGARYAKPVGNKKVDGFSIRFAEEAARCLGNLLIESVVNFDDDERRFIKVLVTDLESNITYDIDVVLQKTVERKSPRQGQEILRSRTNSKNETVYVIRADEDDLLNKQNAMLSKAIRNGVLRHLPGDIQDAALAQIRATGEREDAADPDAAIKRVAGLFYDRGVSAREIEVFLGHALAQISSAELTLLRNIYTAMKEEGASWAEITEAKEQEKPTGPTAKGAAAAIKQKLGKDVDPDLALDKKLAENA